MRNRHPFKRWLFDCPEMMQGVNIAVKKQDPITKTYNTVMMDGRIVAFCDDDINSGPMFRVRFLMFILLHFYCSLICYAILFFS